MGKKYFKSIEETFGKKTFFYLFVLLIGLILNGLFELLGVGTLILIVNLLSSNEISCSADSILNSYFNLCQFDYSKIIIISLIIFCLKAIYQVSIQAFKSFFVSEAIFIFLQKSYSLILKLKQDQIDNLDLNKINTIFAKEFDVIFNSFLDKLLDLITEAIVLIFMLGFLIFIIPEHSFYILILVILILIMYLRINTRKTRTSGANRTTSLISINSIVNDTFMNSKIYKVFSKQSIQINKFKKIIRSFVKANVYHFLIIRIPRIMFENGLITIILMSLLISSYLYSDEQILYYFSIYGLVFLRLYPAISRIKISLDTCLYRYSSFNSSLNIISDLRKKAEIKQNTLEINSNNITIIQDLSLNYGRKKIIENQKLIIEPNKYYLITGKSGAGKSTLINYICGFRKANFLYDKIIYKNSYLNFKNISFVAQRVTLLDDILMKSLLLERKVNRKKIRNILNDLKLGHLINKLNKRPNFDNNDLSLGEIQRINIARAFLLDFDILILDEPISSVDKNNREIIMKFLKKFKGKKTIIMSSHIIDQSEDFDYILKIESGNIKIKKI
tara:strand:+ start:13762 stop:15441 length:1680 start_codon:yes stop_codon:yes gene_type:complete